MLNNQPMYNFGRCKVRCYKLFIRWKQFGQWGHDAVIAFKTIHKPLWIKCSVLNQAYSQNIAPRKMLIHKWNRNYMWPSTYRNIVFIRISAQPRISTHPEQAPILKAEERRRWSFLQRILQQPCFITSSRFVITIFFWQNKHTTLA